MWLVIASILFQCQVSKRMLNFPRCEFLQLFLSSLLLLDMCYSAISCSLLFLLAANSSCNRYLSALLNSFGRFAKYITLKLRSHCELNIDLIKVIMSGQNEEILGQSQKMWNWPVDKLPHPLQHCPWSGLLLCNFFFLIFGVTKNLAVFFHLDSLQNKCLANPLHLTVFWPLFPTLI